MHKLADCTVILALLIQPVAGSAGTPSIDVDTSVATRFLQISCSGKPIDEAEFANSVLLKHQLEHQARFGKVYNLENYLTGLRSIARCEVPAPDPFRFAALVQRRDDMRKAVEFLVSRKQEIGERTTALIAPYVPPAMNFRRSVVVLPASFSCGGFARGGSFFIDIPCVAADVTAEYDGIVSLVAHETYHAVQDDLMPKAAADFETVQTANEGREFLFEALAAEGSASFVADARKITGQGQFARFSRNEAVTGFKRLPETFKLFDYAMELLNYRPTRIRERLRDFYSIVFGGEAGQPGYYMGQQMAAEIVGDFGPAALPCVLSLPAENYVLAYDRAYSTGPRLPDSQTLGASTIAAARQLAASRASTANLAACLRRDR